MGLVPFQRHNADVGELHACGAGLLSDAAEALDNGSLTSNRYQPAIENWDGMCAPELANARSPILSRADDSHHALAWAAVVTQYWADRVIKFNAEVDVIQAEIGTDGNYGADGEGGEPPTEDDIAAARSAARQRWNTAYNTYILDGEDQVQSMLDDGPTAANLALVTDAGVLPPPPPGAINYLNRTGDVVNGINGGLAAYAWYRGGLASYWQGQGLYYQGLANRFSLQAQGIWGRYQDGGYWRRGHYRTLPNGNRIWIDSRFVARSGQAATQAARLDLYGRAQDGFRSTSQRAVDASRAAQPHSAAASRFNTAARWGGRASTVLTAGTSAWDQWSQDAGRNDLATDERVARAATRSATTTAGAAAGAWAGAKGGALAGAAIGSIFPGPGTAIGAVAGGIIGGVAGGFIGSEVGGRVADAVVDGAGDLYNGAKDKVGDAVESLKFW